MLTDEEFVLVWSSEHGPISEFVRYRDDHGVPIEAARDAVFDAALQRYTEITGFVETNFHALWHHRLSLLGPDCRACGKPLRTPRAKLCAECWAPRADITQAAEEESRT